MFLCTCTSCGRRELRGPRSLSLTPDGRAVATCRACGDPVLVATTRGHRHAPAARPDRTPLQAA